jgi:hypothetical protein
LTIPDAAGDIVSMPPVGYNYVCRAMIVRSAWSKRSISSTVL